jgi:hypothetical protein
VKEAIIPTGTTTGTTDRDIDLNKLKAVLDRCNVVVTERKPSEHVSVLYYFMKHVIYVFAGEFTVKNLPNDLPRLLKGAAESLDSSAAIRTFMFESHLSCRLIDVDRSPARASHCTGCVVCPDSLSFIAQRSYEPRDVHYSHSRSVAIYETRCKRLEGFELSRRTWKDCSPGFSPLLVHGAHDSLRLGL